MATGAKSFQRAANRALVLRVLREEPGLTRSALSERVGLDRSTMTLIAGELLEAGLIREQSPQQTTGAPAGRVGRRPVGLELCNERLCALGVEIEAERYQGVIRDNSGNTHYRFEGAGDFASDPWRAIQEVTRQEITRAYENGLSVVGAAYAIPGHVDPGAGRILHSRALRLKGSALPAHVAVEREESVLEVPIVFDNDANCCAWGELHAAGGDKDIVFVLGRLSGGYLGIGLGLALDGRLHYGAHCAAGEIYTHGWRGDERSQLSLTAEEALRLLGDENTRRRIFLELLDSLAPVVSVIDPSEVCFGGVMAEYFDEIERLLKRERVDSYLGRMSRRCGLRAAWSGPEMIAEGAAGMFLERLFTVPRLDRPLDHGSITWERVVPILETVP